MVKLAIITATTNPFLAEDCIDSWSTNAREKPLIVIVVNGREWSPERAVETTLVGHWICVPDYLGTVAAFKTGVDYLLALDESPDIIACLHDDFEINESRWDEKVLRHFERHPACGLAGFGGAIGLGAETLYQQPYDPMQLARIGFRSNLTDAEIHGMRSLLPERVACLDGFSQVGLREFWLGQVASHTWKDGKPINILTEPSYMPRPWNVLVGLGFRHHFYDGALGCLAKRYGWETWYLPLRGHHFGGRTAVGDQGYGDWAKTQIEGGDRGFWEAAHRAGYEAFREELPLRV